LRHLQEGRRDAADGLALHPGDHDRHAYPVWARRASGSAHHGRRAVSTDVTIRGLSELPIVRRGFSEPRGACGVRLTAPRRCRTPPARLRRPTGPGTSPQDRQQRPADPLRREAPGAPGPQDHRARSRSIPRRSSGTTGSSSTSAARPARRGVPRTQRRRVAGLSGHFTLSKVALGTCDRPYGTPCQHEHACVRCPMLRVDLAQVPGCSTSSGTPTSGSSRPAASSGSARSPPCRRACATSPARSSKPNVCRNAPTGRRSAHGYSCDGRPIAVEDVPSSVELGWRPVDR